MLEFKIMIDLIWNEKNLEKSCQMSCFKKVILLFSQILKDWIESTNTKISGCIASC